MQTGLLKFFPCKPGPSHLQSEASGVARVEPPAESEQRARAVKFVDLFAGIGGASTGAMNAGYVVTLAVDSCDKVLATHEANHPHARHVCTTLPSPEPLPVPAAGERWHLHGSPPCTLLSSANVRGDADPARQEWRHEEGLRLVRWYLDYALASSADTWSMEQVPSPQVIALLDEYRRPSAPHRSRLAYHVFRFDNIGVPQRRRRLIAGTPKLIARLRRAKRQVRSVRSVIAEPRGTHTRNGNQKGAPVRRGSKEREFYGPDDHCLPISEPSHTVIAGYPLKWATPHTGTPLKSFSVAESAALQCFPEDYVHIGCAGQATKGIGNAVPPLVMRKLLTDPDGGRPPSPSLAWRLPVTPRWLVCTPLPFG